MKWQKVLLYPAAILFGFSVVLITGAFQVLFSMLSLAVDALVALAEWLNFKEKDSE